MNLENANRGYNALLAATVSTLILGAATGELARGDARFVAYAALFVVSAGFQFYMTGSRFFHKTEVVAMSREAVEESLPYFCGSRLPLEEPYRLDPVLTAAMSRERRLRTMLASALLYGLLVWLMVAHGAAQLSWRTAVHVLTAGALLNAAVPGHFLLCLAINAAVVFSKPPQSVEGYLAASLYLAAFLTTLVCFRYAEMELRHGGVSLPAPKQREMLRTALPYALQALVILVIVNIVVPEYDRSQKPALREQVLRRLSAWNADLGGFRKTVQPKFHSFNKGSTAASGAGAPSGAPLKQQLEELRRYTDALLEDQGKSQAQGLPDQADPGGASQEPPAGVRPRGSADAQVLQDLAKRYRELEASAESDPTIASNPELRGKTEDLSRKAETLAQTSAATAAKTESGALQQQESSSTLNKNDSSPAVAGTGNKTQESLRELSRELQDFEKKVADTESQPQLTSAPSGIGAPPGAALKQQLEDLRRYTDALVEEQGQPQAQTLPDKADPGASQESPAGVRPRGSADAQALQDLAKRYRELEQSTTSDSSTASDPELRGKMEELSRKVETLAQSDTATTAGADQKTQESLRELSRELQGVEEKFNQQPGPAKPDQPLIPEKVLGLAYAFCKGVFYIGLVILVLIFAAKLSRRVSPAAKKRKRLDRATRRMLQEQLDLLAKKKLSAREEVIERYQAFLRIMGEVGFAREEWLPPTDYCLDLSERFPSLRGNLVRVTDLFCETLYAEWPVRPEALKQFRKDCDVLKSSFLR